jgi:uncharacterized protein (TIGR02145 family)
MKTYQFAHIILLLSIPAFSHCDKKQEIENKAPTCTITSPRNGLEIIQGQTVIVLVEAGDSDGSVVDVVFSLDGRGVAFADSSPYSYNWNTSAVDTGRHTITATARDNQESVATDEIQVYLIKEGENGKVLVAAFSASQTSVYLGTSVQFTDESTKDPTTWHWEFGDGNTSSMQNPSHLYETTGTYTVSLTVSNSFGSDTLTLSDYVSVSVSIGESGTLTDYRDEQTYKTIQIGNQVWMAENLNYASSEGSWIYDHDSTNTISFGRLYIWETARDVCPFGWHLPSDYEWRQLENAIGMNQNAINDTGWRGTKEGSKLKADSTWYGNGHGNDEYGFNALPGGYRYNNGNFGYMGKYAFFWSSTAFDEDYAYYRALHYSTDQIDRHLFNKNFGFSVRCVRDF